MRGATVRGFALNVRIVALPRLELHLIYSAQPLFDPKGVPCL